jgi:RNA polymerase sigma-70 factor (sigma-E family)
MTVTVSGADPSGPPGPAAVDEVDVVPGKRVAADRDAEFSAFASAASADLARTAWFLTGNGHQAGELVQEALVRTYVAWPRAREGDPLAYARRVLVHARIDLWRRRRREVLLAPEHVPEAAQAGHTAGVEQRDQLARALATLSGRQRRVVVLRYFVGLSEREVAEDLGVSVGAVKTHSSRGLRALRTAMNDDLDGSVR